MIKFDFLDKEETSLLVSFSVPYNRISSSNWVALEFVATSTQLNEDVWYDRYYSLT